MTDAPAALQWVVVSGYPTWPSPYFADLERHAPPALRLSFATDLDTVMSRPGPPGVVNPHRLRRLYRYADRRHRVAVVEAMLHRFDVLRSSGWRLVWTVHNLYPIDDGQLDEADRLATSGLLEFADALVTHTCADAAHLAGLTDTPVTVCGWAAPTAVSDDSPVPQETANLADDIGESPFPVLVLGNMTSYKDLLATVEAHLMHTRTSRLFLVGPCPDTGLAARLHAAAASTDRVRLHTGRIDPGHAHLLYRAASAALCPYRTSGRWEYFTRVLYPASVATALAWGAPVIAPDLSAVREMTEGAPRLLYPPSAGPGLALAAAEADPPPRVAPTSPDVAWRAVTDAYAQLAMRLAAEPPLATGRAERTP